MRLLCLLLTTALLPSCAAIFQGSSMDISVKTDPPGAKATVDGSVSKTTPCSFTLERDVEHQVFVEKEGFNTYTVNVRSVESGMIAGNLLFGGIIGIAVDAASGASKTLKPDEITLVLAEGEEHIIVPDKEEEEAKRKEEEAAKKGPKSLRPGMGPATTKHLN